jgi:glycosyltransferase involved in cell wall biosynthesis
MQVISIVPGSGGTFYCENCLRDSALTKALRRLGHDVCMVPMYLPMFSDEPGISGRTPIFFGGINVYLQQQFAMFRHTPRWIDRLLDSRWLLALAARREGSTSAANMGAMTLSMINGQDGNQAKELERLVAWLADQEQPDVIHLSSVMLIGLARRIKEALGVPIVCSLMDEDTWVDAMQPPYIERNWDAMARRAGDIDAFIAVSNHYRDRMAARLRLNAARITTVYAGIEFDGYRESPLPMQPPVVGYISKICRPLGFETLLDAVLQLRGNGFHDLQLAAVGGIADGDRHFVEQMRRKAAAAGAAEALRMTAATDRAARQALLAGTTVLAVPMPEGEAFGTFLVEAWAAGVPVVQPDAGAFGEIIGITGGGVTYRPATVDALADALADLLRNPAKARAMGRAGRDVARRRFNIATMAAAVTQVYRAVVGEAAA